MPLLLVSSVETVEEQEFPIASLRAPPLPFFLFLFLFSFDTSTREGGEGRIHLLLDKRVTRHRGNACPLSQDSIRTSLESKYEGLR